MGNLTELFILLAIAIFVLVYRRNNGENTYKYVKDNVEKVYDKYAPYSFKIVREKAIELGQEFTPREYLTQITIIGGIAAVIGYFYFYSIIWAVVYAIIAIAFIPLIAFDRGKQPVGVVPGQQNDGESYVFSVAAVHVKIRFAPAAAVLQRFKSAAFDLRERGFVQRFCVGSFRAARSDCYRFQSHIHTSIVMHSCGKGKQGKGSGSCGPTLSRSQAAQGFPICPGRDIIKYGPHWAGHRK